MICNECETVAHCLKNGCVPKQPAPVHFAWMRYEVDCAGEPVLVLARSTEEGAFKVYKEPPAQPAPVHDCFWKREGYKECPAAPVQQEPVAWVHDCAALLQNNVELWIDRCPHCGKPRITPPNVATPLAAQRQWVGLTDEEIEKACVPLGAAMLSFTEVARAIEAKLKEKNL